MGKTKIRYEANVTETVLRTARIKSVTVSNVDVLHALATLDPCKNHQSENRYVEYGDHRYALKEIVRRTVARSADEPDSTDADEDGEFQFHSEHGVTLLESLGFETINTDSE
ncbi:hypothetical protein [Natrinema longum]|uniref:Uncharacterized protein n=1 Tax=Natrinema longum TaxID=370324 RepID=A0A8A2U909_9EURY|nr:hypothetical protein [Natrinema longum]QSW85167.1 hypothetical protein J0X27_17260 [Natrinema longum]